jgi:hypothetical protein
MKSSGNTKHERALLEDLRHAVHGLRAPFACGGTFVPEQPVTVCFPDKTRIPVLRAKVTFEQEQLLQPLVKRCGAAPFGMGLGHAEDYPCHLAFAPSRFFISVPAAL